eukprot:CAMPEP_0176478866 /NCGR_PEP_ID=MMETSP0200_2-20121128/1418_1 /TAXON_ID=947934 /ORGANISM="Chaetoceros sp., Strain GSL56" /LENGTH=47 /DNA_ID= /DNA_START= /DNA_END= /DNA_ORIENTATION=
MVVGSDEFISVPPQNTPMFASERERAEPPWPLLVDAVPASQCPAPYG